MYNLNKNEDLYGSSDQMYIFNKNEDRNPCLLKISTQSYKNKDFTKNAYQNMIKSDINRNGEYHPCLYCTESNTLYFINRRDFNLIMTTKGHMKHEIEDFMTWKDEAEQRDWNNLRKGIFHGEKIANDYQYANGNKVLEKAYNGGGDDDDVNYLEKKILDKYTPIGLYGTHIVYDYEIDYENFV